MYSMVSGDWISCNMTITDYKEELDIQIYISSILDV